MSEEFRVSFESPQCGWMSVSLEARGARLVTSVAHAPYDSLVELMNALVSLLEGREREVVRWNREPEELDFRFDARDGEVGLEVLRYADHRRASASIVFAVRAAKEELCGAFWRELRGLRRRCETDEFEQNWRRPFPEAELRRLTETFRDYKKKTVRARR
jgi:hypothetical protein